MLKKTTLILLLVLTAINCGNGSYPGSNAGNGSLVIAITSNATKTALPQTDTKAVRYTITGEGPGGGSFMRDNTGISEEITGLTFGKWIITVTGYNSDGIAILEGSAIVLIETGKTASCSITLLPKDGIGYLHIKVVWLSHSVARPMIEATISAQSGESETISFSIGHTSAEALIGKTSGYYDLNIRLYDGARAMMAYCGGDTEVVRILSGQTTETEIKLRQALPQAKDVGDEELAYHWAPVHYQAVDLSRYGGKGDFITRLDRTGNWNLNMTKDFTSYPDIPAYVYYSIVTSATHHYISYYFYHPMDLKNSIEGAMFVIRRDGSYGELEAVLTHDAFTRAYFPYINRTDRVTSPYSMEPYKLIFSNEAMDIMNDDVYRVITEQSTAVQATLDTDSTSTQFDGRYIGCWGYDPNSGDENKWGFWDYVMSIAENGGNHYYDFALNPNNQSLPHIRYIPYPQDAYPSDITPDITPITSLSEQYMYCGYKLINVFGANGLWHDRGRSSVFNSSFNLIDNSTLCPWNWDGLNNTYDFYFVNGINDYISEDGIFHNYITIKDQYNSFSDGDKVNLGSGRHPWTHDPAALCWVYLMKLNEGVSINDLDLRYYFSDAYYWNGYIDE